MWIACLPGSEMSSRTRDEAHIRYTFHPEVAHTPGGTDLLRNFAVNICETRQHWTMDVGNEISRIRKLVGEKGQVIGRYPRHLQGIHSAEIWQALYLGESTLRFVSSRELECQYLISIGSCEVNERGDWPRYAVLVCESNKTRILYTDKGP